MTEKYHPGMTRLKIRSLYCASFWNAYFNPFEIEGRGVCVIYPSIHPQKEHLSGIMCGDFGCNTEFSDTQTSVTTAFCQHITSLQYSKSFHQSCYSTPSFQNTPP